MLNHQPKPEPTNNPQQTPTPTEHSPKSSRNQFNNQNKQQPVTQK